MFYKASNKELVDSKNIPHLSIETKQKIYIMRHLKFKKIQIAKVNNLNAILGGNDRQTVVQGCVHEDTFTCPPEKSNDPNNASCQTTNNGTLAGNPTDGIAGTERCGG